MIASAAPPLAMDLVESLRRLRLATMREQAPEVLQNVHGNADSDAMKDLGKPGAGDLHARFDERGLETGHGLGTAAPAA